MEHKLQEQSNYYFPKTVSSGFSPGPDKPVKGNVGGTSSLMSHYWAGEGQLYCSYCTFLVASLLREHGVGMLLWESQRDAVPLCTLPAAQLMTCLLRRQLPLGCLSFKLLASLLGTLQKVQAMML